MFKKNIIHVFKFNIVVNHILEMLLGSCNFAVFVISKYNNSSQTDGKKGWHLVKQFALHYCHVKAKVQHTPMFQTRINSKGIHEK